MTIEVGIAIEIAIENGAIGEWSDNDPDHFAFFAASRETLGLVPHRVGER